MSDINAVIENARKLASKGADQNKLSEYFQAEGFSDEDIITHLNQGKAGTGPVSFVDNMVRQFANAATFNTADEIAAGLDAAVTAPFTDKTLGETYDERLNYHRGRDKAFAELYPKASLAANVAGGVGTALATGGTSLPASVGGAMVRGGTQGGIYAGLGGFGAGEGGFKERLGNAATMAPVGVIGGGLLSGGFAALSPYLQKAWSAVVTNNRLFNPQTQTLTPAGRLTLQQSGVNLADMSDDAVREFTRMANTAVNPAQVGRAAQAATLPVPVRLTQGQITMQPGQQMTEDLMLKGALGQPASMIMQQAAQQQQQALRGNIPAIQARIAGQNALVQPGEGAAAAQAALAAQRGTERTAAGAMFDTAREASAALPKSAVLDGSRAVRAAVEMDHEITGLSRTSGLLNRLDDIIGQSGDDINSQVAISRLFDWRKQASSAARGNPGSEEGVAIRKAIGGFDDWIGQTVDDALLQGDEAAVGLWRRAIGGYREFASRFKAKDIVDKLTQRAPEGGAATLRVAPEDAANYIFGISSTGWLNKADLNRGLNKIREILGGDSAAWNSLKQEAFLRIMRSAEGGMQGGERQLSGANILKAWQDAQRNNMPMIAALFTEPERRLIGQFATVAAQVTNPVRGGQNFSNTAPAMANIVSRLGSVFGNRVATVLANIPLVGPLMQGASAVRAAGAAAGQPQRYLPSASYGAGAASGLVTNQGQRQ